jgi:hypothetical protein
MFCGVHCACHARFTGNASNESGMRDIDAASASARNVKHTARACMIAVSALAESNQLVMRGIDAFSAASVCCATSMT